MSDICTNTTYQNHFETNRHLCKQVKLKSYQQTSKPTTFSTNNISGGFNIDGINSRIVRNDNARASAEPFCNPEHTKCIPSFTYKKKQKQIQSCSRYLALCMADKEAKEAIHAPHNDPDHLQLEFEYYPAFTKQ